MKQPKVTLANVLLIIAGLGFGFTIYLSINFITLGDTSQSILSAFIITLFLAGFALGAQLLKRAQKNFKTTIILELVALLLFIVVAFLAINPFSHVFTVFKKKEDIENKVMENINQAQKMFEEYENYVISRENNYRRKLKSVIASKLVNPEEYNNIGFDNVRSDNDQINFKVFILHTKLMPSNFQNDTIQKQDGIKGAAVKWLNEVNKIVKSDFGFMFGIVKIINEAPIKIDSWKLDLIEFSKYRADTEAVEDFTYPLDFKTVQNQLTEIESPTLLSLILTLIAYSLMLLPYFLTRRSSRFPGVKIVFGGSNSSDNEL